MTISLIKRICWFSTAAMAVGCIGALAAAAVLSYDLGQPAQSGVMLIAHVGSTRSIPRPTITDFEPYLDTALRRPLPKPPPPPAPLAPPVVVQPVDVGFNLLGTVTEASNSYAIFQTADGLQLKRVGETIAGVTVIGITEGVVDMRRSSGESTTVRVPLPPGSP